MDQATEINLGRVKKWRPEVLALRVIVLYFPFEEEFKWGWPCFTLNKRNFAHIHEFKEYCAVLFFKGALISDPQGILSRIGNNTQSGRQFRFTSVEQVRQSEPVLKDFIEQAIQVEKAGLKVEYSKATELTYPAELQSKLDSDPIFKAAFLALTPDRQKAYNYFFSTPKQSRTREARVKKWSEQILSGKGLND